MASSYCLALLCRNASWTRASIERGIGAEDPLQLRPGLGVAAGVHVGGGQEVARPQIRGLQQHHAAEGLAGPIVQLLLVVDRAHLHPHARVARRELGQRLDLGLRLLEAPEADQQVAQPLDEGRVVGIGLHGPAIDLDGLVGAALRLVHVPERGPRAVVIGIELDRAREAGDGLVPVLRLDRQASEQELRLDVLGLPVDQPQQDRARPVVRLLLHQVAGEREVRLLGVGVERDDRCPARLPPRSSSSGSGRARPASGAPGPSLGDSCTALPGGGQRLGRLIGAHQPLRELAPQ